MGRYNTSGSYDHGLERFGPDEYRMHWTYDAYYSGTPGPA